VQAPLDPINAIAASIDQTIAGMVDDTLQQFTDQVERMSRQRVIRAAARDIRVVSAEVLRLAANATDLVGAQIAEACIAGARDDLIKLYRDISPAGDDSKLADVVDRFLRAATAQCSYKVPEAAEPAESSPGESEPVVAGRSRKARRS
jgi:hypothetical protein